MFLRTHVGSQTAVRLVSEAWPVVLTWAHIPRLPSPGTGMKWTPSCGRCRSPRAVSCWTGKERELHMWQLFPVVKRSRNQLLSALIHRAERPAN